MKKILVLLATLGAISGAVQAQAQAQIKVLSTQELVNTCKLPASPESRSFCIGYTSAIYDTYLATRHPQSALGYLAMRFPCGKK